MNMSNEGYQQAKAFLRYPGDWRFEFIAQKVCDYRQWRDQDYPHGDMWKNLLFGMKEAVAEEFGGYGSDLFKKAWGKINDMADAKTPGDTSLVG